MAPAAVEPLLFHTHGQPSLPSWPAAAARPGAGVGAPGDPQVKSQAPGMSAWAKRVAVVALIVLGATALSIWLPVGRELCTWCKVSSATGWTYFLCWSISFYPQLLNNYRRKSVEGLSFDFMALNILGFACYSVFNLALRYSPVVRAEYNARFAHGSVAVPVEFNDVLFSLHALVASLALAAQCLIYPRGPHQRVSLGTSLAIAGSLALGAAGAGWLWVHGEARPVLPNAPWLGATWLDLCYLCSFIKMGVSLCKYVPQVHLNHSRQSTEGWSIDNVLLDFAGGALSLAQLLVTCEVLHDWSAVTGNPIKFGLALISIGFDVVFILQHYVWFRDEPEVVTITAKQAEADADLAAPLLVSSADAAEQRWQQRHAHILVLPHPAAHSSS